MATIKQLYGALATLTITINALASAALRSSAAVDNEADPAVDILIAATLTNHATSAPTGEQAVHLYAAAALDDAEPYTDGANGTDAAVTLQNRAHLRYLGSAYFSAAAQTRDIGPFSLGEVFGGKIPSEWEIVVENATGFALGAAAGSIKYRPVQYQTV